MPKRSDLRGVAYNIAHQFAASAQHYARMAIDLDVGTIRIDLLTGTIEPPEFDIRRNRILAERCQTTLKHIITYSLNRPLCAARLMMVMGDDTLANPARVNVALIDDRDRQWGDDRSVILWRSDVCYGSGHFFFASAGSGRDFA